MRKIKKRTRKRAAFQAANIVANANIRKSWGRRPLRGLLAFAFILFLAWCGNIWWQVSHESCTFNPNNLPKGTLYWGGAGLDGPYIKRHSQHFAEVGIKNVYVGRSMTASQWLAKPLNMFADAFRAGLLLRSPDNGDWAVCGMKGGAQFNLIGYSYGSSLAAQTALAYARRGVVVDHLILIGSPIGPELKTALLNNPRINVHFVDLREYGDPIYPGMSMGEVASAVPTLVRQMIEDKGEGHFYYAHDVSDSDDRIRALARQVYNLGVR